MVGFDEEAKIVSGCSTLTNYVPLTFSPHLDHIRDRKLTDLIL